MKDGSIYLRRTAFLQQLPACFSFDECRTVTGLSQDATWQTCHHWQDLELVRQLEKGYYLKVSQRIKLPLIFHRAAATEGDSYFSGLCALARQGMIRRGPHRVDVITLSRRSAILNLAYGEIRFHRLAGTCPPDGLIEIKDGGRVLVFAIPEQVIIDCLRDPNRLLGMVEVAEIIRTKKRQLRQKTLLDLVLKTGSEAVYRRMLSLAEYGGMVRLADWLDQCGPIHPRMGRTLLDPHRNTPNKAPVRHGLIWNIPLPPPFPLIEK